MVSFLNLSTFIHWQPSVDNRFPFSPLLFLSSSLPSFLSEYYYRLMVSLYIQCVNNLLLSFFFKCSNCPRFSQLESLPAGSCGLLTCPHHYLSTSLLSGTMFLTHFELCQPQSFFPGALDPFSGECI